MNIRWDAVNWLTVLLMVSVGYVAFGLVRSVIFGAKSSSGLPNAITGGE